jgi:hypothetical protein
MMSINKCSFELICVLSLEFSDPLRPASTPRYPAWRVRATTPKPSFWIRARERGKPLLHQAIPAHHPLQIDPGYHPMGSYE